MIRVIIALLSPTLFNDLLPSGSVILDHSHCLSLSLDRSLSSLCPIRCQIESSAVSSCPRLLERRSILYEIDARFVSDLDRFLQRRMVISNADGDSVANKEGDMKRKRETEWQPSPRKWRTHSEQRTYSSKLLDALRRVRSSKPAVEAFPQSRAIREAADRALAVAARGRTRWSRAILSKRKLGLKPSRPRPAVASSSTARSMFSSSGHGNYCLSKKNGSPDVEGKAAVLGRLVPGCRKLSFTTLLEEASDYIAALEMQVRAMAALTAILSSGGTSSPETNRAAL